jgi:hypothetical protein
MKDIRLDWLLGPGVSSWTISRWGGTPHLHWSHCASMLEDGRYIDARDDVLDGVPAGIQYRGPKIEAWVARRRVVIPVEDQVYDDWEGNLRAKVTDGYAVPDIEGTIVDRMLHKVATYDCSALLINELQHVKLLRFPLVVPAHELTPNVALVLVSTIATAVIGDIEEAA